MITRYIVLKDRKQSQELSYSVVEVSVEDGVFSTPVKEIEVHFSNGKSQLVKRDWIYQTKYEALQVCKERRISNIFKNKNTIDGMCVCSSCGLLVPRESITVDHIKPIFSFKRRGVYISGYHWRKCWSEENLALMCESCNKSKSYMSAKKHLSLNKKATYEKMKVAKRRNQKIKVDSIELAKRDSRILDKNIILKNKPALWERINKR